MSQFTVGGVQFTLSREDVEVKLKDVAPEPVRELFDPQAKVELMGVAVRQA